MYYCEGKDWKSLPFTKYRLAPLHNMHSKFRWDLWFTEIFKQGGSALYTCTSTHTNVHEYFPIACKFILYSRKFSPILPSALVGGIFYL